MLIGNVARDPEVRTTANGIKRLTFTLAVNRLYKNAQGVREADCIPGVAWREKADFLEKYIAKGKKLGVSGELQVRSYDTQDEQKRYIYEVIADEVEFLSPAKTEQAAAEPPAPDKDGLTEAPDSDLPF